MLQLYSCFEIGDRMEHMVDPVLKYVPHLADIVRLYAEPQPLNEDMMSVVRQALHCKICFESTMRLNLNIVFNDECVVTCEFVNHRVAFSPGLTIGDILNSWMQHGLLAGRDHVEFAGYLSNASAVLQFSSHCY